MKRFFSVVGKGVGLIGRGLGVAGRATIALVGICGVVAALANYAMTQGSGTNFGSIVVSTVHYVQMLVCDPTTPSQCGAVSAAGAQKVDGSAVTQPVSVASSAVAPGAYQAGALVAGAGADGWDVPEGHTTDTACPASGTATVVGCARTIAQAATTPLNNSSIPINISTATTTQLVALSGSTAIYITSYDVIAGGTGNITFEYGTGTACATGTTVLTGAYPLVAQAGISKGDGIGTVLKVPAGNALCALTSAGVQMSGSVSYQQF